MYQQASLGLFKDYVGEFALIMASTAAAVTAMDAFRQHRASEKRGEVARWKEWLGPWVLLAGLSASFVLGRAPFWVKPGADIWTLPMDPAGHMVFRMLAVAWSAFVSWMFPSALRRWFDRDKQTQRKRNIEVPTGPLPASGKEADMALELYKLAIDTRKLELQLFWQRSGFFWGFLAAALAGYVGLKDESLAHFRLLLVHIGLVASVAWLLVNRGSKYWHENWEQMVRALEADDKTGLFNQTAPLEEKGPLGAGGYSVSRITIFFSGCIVAIFIGLAANEVILRLYGASEAVSQAGPVVLAVLTFTAVAYVVLDGVSGSTRLTQLGGRVEDAPKKSPAKAVKPRQKKR